MLEVFSLPDHVQIKLGWRSGVKHLRVSFRLDRLSASVDQKVTFRRGQMPGAGTLEDEVAHVE